MGSSVESKNAKETSGSEGSLCCLFDFSLCLTIHVQSMSPFCAALPLFNPIRLLNHYLPILLSVPCPLALALSSPICCPSACSYPCSRKCRCTSNIPYPHSSLNPPMQASRGNIFANWLFQYFSHRKASIMPHAICPARQSLLLFPLLLSSLCFFSLAFLSTKRLLLLLFVCSKTS